jgi:hypothetical protein
MNNIDKKIIDTYYDLPDFKKANSLFENFLNNCEFEEEEESVFSSFNISTITSIIKIATFLNLKVLFESIDLSSDIAYIEFKNQIKGIKEQKKLKYKNTTTGDKRKRNKGKTFANQLSIGFLCTEHIHKKPICVKIFSKGSLTITGTKSSNEINKICNLLLSIFSKINKIFVFQNKEIILLPYKNLVTEENVSISVETVNGSFKTNYKINLIHFKKKIREFYQSEKIYIKSNRSALLELDLKIYGFFDKRKKKLKTPKISIYGTGSIVINSINEELLFKSYEFIKKFLLEHKKDIIDQNYVFNL